MQLFKGECVNHTSEAIAVYNAGKLFKLPPGRKTPGGWDCDGYFVPNDRTAKPGSSPAVRGPAAIKYHDLRWPEVFMTTAGTYDSETPTEVFKPTSNPHGWDIPNQPHTYADTLLEVPGHIAK